MTLQIEPEASKTAGINRTLNQADDEIPCYDIHTHILPDEWPDWASKFKHPNMLTIRKTSDTKANLFQNGAFFRPIEANCWCARTRRTEMAGIMHTKKQVLSTVPALGFNYYLPVEEALEIARFLNDHIAEICRKDPSHFIGLATIPLQDPVVALKELQRCLDPAVGFKGIQIGTNIAGKSLGDPVFRDFWRTIETAKCPVFVHPWDMPQEKRYTEHWFPWLIGMPCETTQAICSLFFSGVFEQFPKLKICFSHGGGSLLGTLGRIQHGFHARPDLTQISTTRDPFSQLGYIWVDSLFHDKDMLLVALKKLGPYKIIVGSDYPFPLGDAIPGEAIRKLLTEDDVKAIPSCTGLTLLQVKELILHKNLEHFLAL